MSRTRIIVPSGGSGTEEEAAEAARILEEGGVALVPTDTVYGLACRASQPAALERIFRLKGRPRSKPLPYLLADADQLATFVKDVPPPARRLARRFWPGPLTLVLGEDPGVALRVPDQPFLLRVLARLKGPVQATSANPSGLPPAPTLQEALKVFEGEVELAVDAGPASLGRSSSVVRVTPEGEVRILREEALDAEAIRSALVRTVLLVCTGNTCRSPMAAAVLQSLLAEALDVPTDQLEAKGVRVASAGIAALPGAPMTPAAEDALRRAGTTAGAPHGSRPLTAQMAGDADLILGLTRTHVEAVRREFPVDEDHVVLLSPSGRSIPDPIGGDQGVYEDCLDEITSALRERLSDIMQRLDLEPAAG